MQVSDVEVERKYFYFLQLSIAYPIVEFLSRDVRYF